MEGKVAEEITRILNELHMKGQAWGGSAGLSAETPLGRTRDGVVSKGPAADVAEAMNRIQAALKS